MATPTEENFNDYKRAERKALEILGEMRATSPRKVDIELSLLVSIFELHKGVVAPAAIAAIVQNHMKELVPFYAAKTVAAAQGSTPLPVSTPSTPSRAGTGVPGVRMDSGEK